MAEAGEAALEGLRILDMTSTRPAPRVRRRLLGWAPRRGQGRGAGSRRPGAGGGTQRRPGVLGLFLPTGTPTSAVSPSICARRMGRSLFLRLLPRFDVFVGELRPGVIERLGLDYATLKPFIHR